MSQTFPITADQRLANLKALHKQLEEMAVRTKQSGSTEREQRPEVRGPVLVIRGK